MPAGKKIETWRDDRKGIAIDIRLVSAQVPEPYFLAEWQGQEVKAKELAEVRKRLKEIIDSAAQLEWVRVIEIQEVGLVGAFPKGFAFDARRLWLAPRWNGTIAARYTESAERPDGWESAGDYSFPKGHEFQLPWVEPEPEYSWCSTKRRRLYPYSQDLWDRLQELGRVLDALQDRFRELTADPEAMRALASGEAPFLALPPAPEGS